MTRPTWDEWALATAKTISTRANCSRRQVGALILDIEHRIVGAGYNGAPSGTPGCLEGKCPRAQSDVAPSSSYDAGPGVCEAVHAEANAIMHSDPVRRMHNGATIYSTEEPCHGCMTLIKGSGITRALWPGGEWVDALHLRGRSW